MKYIGTKELETERLILRKLTANDYADAYINWCSSEEVSKYVLWSKHKDPIFTKMLYEAWENEYEDLKTYRWIVELKKTKDLIGVIDVVSKKYMVFGTVEIGYCYGEKFWNKGYASEALKRVIKFLFEECDVDTICAEHMSNNIASGKVMVNSGMTYEGTLKSRVIDKNNLRNDLLSYSITKEEYFKKN